MLRTPAGMRSEARPPPAQGRRREGQLSVWPATQLGCPACLIALSGGRDREEAGEGSRCGCSSPGVGDNQVEVQALWSSSRWPSGYPVFTIPGLARPPGTFPCLEVELPRQRSAPAAPIVAAKLSPAAGRGGVSWLLSWAAVENLQTEGLCGVRGVVC